MYGFERLGGVPVDKIRYDNLNSAVKQVLFTVVARHQRAIGKGAKVLDLDHYLEILHRKPAPGVRRAIVFRPHLRRCRRAYL